MLRPAVPADLARLLEIRDAAGEDALSDPALVDADALARMIAAGKVSVWTVAERIAGFAAACGATIHLLADSGHRGGGIGRALLADACARVKAGGETLATLTLAPGGGAEPHYRAAGWAVAGRSEPGGRVLQKPL
jgi:GNAT superfamily N-acetyltransferase